MDKYLKMFEPSMKRWLSEHYSPEEAKERWERTVALDEKWIREEGDLGGKKNPLADNMLEAYAFFAFYDSVDRSFRTEDLQIMIDTAMGKSIRTFSHFNLNKLLKHRWIVRLIYRHLESYQKNRNAFAATHGETHGRSGSTRISTRKGSLLFMTPVL